MVPRRLDRTVYIDRMVSTGSPTAWHDEGTNGEDDWPVQMAETITRVVGTVRDKTTGPALTIARAIVYGTFAAVVGLVVAVLFVIALVRVVDVYLPDSVFGEQHTWATYLLLGVLFTGSGLLMWAKRRPRERRAH
jgi:hypothetical protein